MCLPHFKHNCLEDSAKCAYLAAWTIPWRRVQCVPTLLQAQVLGGECSVVVPCCLNHALEKSGVCLPRFKHNCLEESAVYLHCCLNNSLEGNVCLPCFKYNCLEESAKCVYLAARIIPWNATCAYLASNTIAWRRAQSVPTLLPEPFLGEESSMPTWLQEPFLGGERTVCLP